MRSRVKSDFLVAQPSFLSGLARLLDLYCLFNSYNSSSSGQEADYKAMLADWKAVGQDIEDAMSQFASMYSPAQFASHEEERSLAARR